MCRNTPVNNIALPPSFFFLSLFTFLDLVPLYLTIRPNVTIKCSRRCLSVFIPCKNAADHELSVGINAKEKYWTSLSTGQVYFMFLVQRLLFNVTFLRVSVNVYVSKLKIQYSILL